jgi:hypothetical protein
MQFRNLTALQNKKQAIPIFYEQLPGSVVTIHTKNLIAKIARKVKIYKLLITKGTICHGVLLNFPSGKFFFRLSGAFFMLSILL